MKRRTRLIASGLTALAMTLSLGEAVLASTCAPEVEAQVGRVVAEALSQAMPCCGPARPQDGAGSSENAPSGSNCPFGIPGSAGQEHGDDRDEAPCPFGPAAGAPGCGAAASLPAHTFDDLAASPESAMVVVFDHTQHSLFFATALFHPPKP